MKRVHHALRALALVLAASACATQARPALVETDDALAAYVAAQSDSGAAAWNRGDLPSYLAPYADSVVVVFPDGPLAGRARFAGRERVNAAWNGAAPAERASVGRSLMRRIGPDDALQTAEIVLRRPGSPERRLWCTVLWARTAAGWRVVHEQSF